MHTYICAYTYAHPHNIHIYTYNVHMYIYTCAYTCIHTIYKYTYIKFTFEHWEVLAWCWRWGNSSQVKWLSWEVWNWVSSRQRKTRRTVPGSRHRTCKGPVAWESDCVGQTAISKDGCFAVSHDFSYRSNILLIHRKVRATLSSLQGEQVCDHSRHHAKHEALQSHFLVAQPPCWMAASLPHGNSPANGRPDKESCFRWFQPFCHYSRCQENGPGPSCRSANRLMPSSY